MTSHEELISMCFTEAFVGGTINSHGHPINKHAAPIPIEEVLCVIREGFYSTLHANGGGGEQEMDENIKEI